MKKAFQKWSKPLVTIHDCIAVLPNDMDDAQERINRAMIHVCQGDPLTRLAEGLKVNSDKIDRLTQEAVDLTVISSADKIFN